MEKDSPEAKALEARIVNHETTYLRTTRAEIGRYPSLSEKFPVYLLGHRCIEVRVTRNGLVISRFLADEDSINFYYEPSMTVREAAPVGDAMLEQMIQHFRSEGYRMLEEEGYAIRSQLAEDTPVHVARPGCGVGNRSVPPLSFLLTTSFDLYC